MTIKRRTYPLKKNLTRKAAYRAVSKRAKSDFRGISYNKRTGKVTIV